MEAADHLSVVIRFLQAVAVDVFIGVFLTIAWCWNLPDDYLSKWICRKFGRAVLYSGLWHAWNMFAPEPLHVNRRLEAVIRCADNEVIVWRAANCSEQNGFRAFLGVRDRKFQDNLMGGHMEFLQPALCDYLARQVRAHGRVPVKVELVMRYRLIAAPGLGAAAPNEERRLLYTFHVQPVVAEANRVEHVLHA